MDGVAEDLAAVIRTREGGFGGKVDVVDGIVDGADGWVDEAGASIGIDFAAVCFTLYLGAAGKSVDGMDGVAYEVDGVAYVVLFEVDGLVYEVDGDVNGCGSTANSFAMCELLEDDIWCASDGFP